MEKGGGEGKRGGDGVGGRGGGSGHYVGFVAKTVIFKKMIFQVEYLLLELLAVGTNEFHRSPAFPPSVFLSEVALSVSASVGSRATTFPDCFESRQHASPAPDPQLLVGGFGIVSSAS